MGDDTNFLPKWLLILTFATSSAFFVAYGTTIFSVSNVGSCDDLIGCIDFFANVMGALFQFLFFGACGADLPDQMALFLFVIVNVPWIVITSRLVVAGVDALIP